MTQTPLFSFLQAGIKCDQNQPQEFYTDTNSKDNYKQKKVCHKILFGIGVVISSINFEVYP